MQPYHPSRFWNSSDQFRAVRRSLFQTWGSAPAARSLATHALFPPVVAQCDGVRPSLSATSGTAPYRRSTSIETLSRRYAAQCRSVQLLQSRWSGDRIPRGCQSTSSSGRTRCVWWCGGNCNPARRREPDWRRAGRGGGWYAILPLLVFATADGVRAGFAFAGSCPSVCPIIIFVSCLFGPFTD